MKRLSKWIGKEVEAITTSGCKLQGFVWVYKSDRSIYWNKPEKEYYIGYDGGMMTLIRPSEIKEIKEIRTEDVEG